MCMYIYYFEFRCVLLFSRLEWKGKHKACQAIFDDEGINFFYDKLIKVGLKANKSGFKIVTDFVSHDLGEYV